MKLVSVIKLVKRNVKKIEDDIMSANGDILVIFAIYGQFRAIRKSNQAGSQILDAWSIILTLL